MFQNKIKKEVATKRSWWLFHRSRVRLTNTEKKSIIKRAKGRVQAFYKRETDTEKSWAKLKSK